MRHCGGASVVADAVLAVTVTTPGPTASPLPWPIVAPTAINKKLILTKRFDERRDVDRRVNLELFDLLDMRRREYFFAPLLA